MSHYSKAIRERSESAQASLRAAQAFFGDISDADLGANLREWLRRNNEDGWVCNSITTIAITAETIRTFIAEEFGE